VINAASESKEKIPEESDLNYNGCPWRVREEILDIDFFPKGTLDFKDEDSEDSEDSEGAAHFLAPSPR